jgi:hypothetical protein
LRFGTDSKLKAGFFDIFAQTSRFLGRRHVSPRFTLKNRAAVFNVNGQYSARKLVFPTIPASDEIIMVLAPPSL